MKQNCRTFNIKSFRQQIACDSVLLLSIVQVLSLTSEKKLAGFASNQQHTTSCSWIRRIEKFSRTGHRSFASECDNPRLEVRRQQSSTKARWRITKHRIRLRSKSKRTWQEQTRDRTTTLTHKRAKTPAKHAALRIYFNPQKSRRATKLGGTRTERLPLTVRQRDRLDMTEGGHKGQKQSGKKVPSSGLSTSPKHDGPVDWTGLFLAAGTQDARCLWSARPLAPTHTAGHVGAEKRDPFGSDARACVWCAARCVTRVPANGVDPFPTIWPGARCRQRCVQ